MSMAHYSNDARAMCRLFCLAACVVFSHQARALDVELRPSGGSPMIHVNGQPVSPLMFFGWESGSGGLPTVCSLDDQWREFSITVESPENTTGESGIHFRMGGEGTGTVWVDNIRVYPGDKTDTPPANWAREGDFEGTREEVSNAWNFYQTGGAAATWKLDPETNVSGKQSLRVDITAPGSNPMHLHWYQTGYSVKKGQKYTYSLWMKADKPRHGDFMMLHIGDPWIIYPQASALDTPFAQQVRLARGAGVHIVSLGIPLQWPKPGDTHDFREVDRCLESALKSDPEALLLPRFGMEPPNWWLQEHPESRMSFDDGETLFFSVASEAWRADMQPPLRALVRHCEEKFGEHILGYHPCGQHTGEWFYQRSWEPVLSDFSPAMEAGFRAWLAARYETVEALRKAWSDPTLDFSSAKIPAAEQQRKSSLGLFRDPAVERALCDFCLYKHIAMETPLETMARIIKEETQRKKLTCFFYGYLFDMHGIPMGPQNSGHLAMARILGCPDVDILCSPISYLDRELGGAGMFMSAVDSVRAHGKLWLNEDDTRTYLTQPADGFGRVDTPGGTLWVHQRNFAQLWPRRLATWYMDLGGVGWLNGQDLWDNIGRLQRFCQKHLAEPALWQPEAVLIVDEDSPNYLAASSTLNSPLVYEMRSQYFRMGAPFGIYLLSDLVAGKISPAKVYFFANCFHLDNKQREAIARATHGKTAVWFYGAGFLNDTASDENISECIGINVARRPAEPAVIQIESGNAELTKNIHEPFGVPATADPLWAATDPGAEILGRYASGGAALAAKQTPGGLRVYIGAWRCPAQLLRNILTASGVHVYCDSGDVLLTDGRFLSLTAASPGSKKISLPKASSVRDALGEQPLFQNVTEFTLDMQLGETRMFLIQ